MKKIIFGLTLALTTLWACTDPNDGETFVQPTYKESEMTAVDILERDADQFSLWIDLLKHADYYNALKNPDAIATVFCPNNDAIKKYLTANGYASVSDIPVDDAKTLVKVHIIADNKVPDNLIDTLASTSPTQATDIPYLTLFGSQLSVRYGYSITDVDDDQREPDSVKHCADSIFFNNQARLDKFTMVTCSNAYLYTMGDVILPLTEDILQKLDQQKEYTIFAQAIRESGYADEVTYQPDNDDETQGVTKRFSCFAVPDAVYHTAGINDVAGLKSYLSAHNQGSADDAELLNYVKYHFQEREYSTSEMFDTTRIGQTVIIDTKYTGQVFTVLQDSAGTRTINDGVKILRSNIVARNGLIHKVDHVMPVFHPTPVRIVWDFLNQSDIIAFVTDWGNQQGLPNLFFSPMEYNKERKLDLSGENYDKYTGDVEITSFTCKYTETATSRSRSPRVGYYKDMYLNKKKPNESVYGDYMNNHMMLNLGYAGWIEFNTPSIIAGKYKIVLHLCKDDEMKSLYNTGTRVQFDLDAKEENQNIVSLYKGAKKGDGTIQTTIWDEMEFDTSGNHTFRMTMRDQKARTDNKYLLRVDCLEFIPIEN
jgi:uncharacterized surface protein with fasciclin (FAS1) repeats